MRKVQVGTARLYEGDAFLCYDDWPSPTCIISDGPYGLGKFPGELRTVDQLAQWYAPHAAAWARRSLPNTTLWFWNSEIGWASAHNALDLAGWQYEEAIIWDKGIEHVAGNCNSKTIRGVPVVTEMAVRYTKKVMLITEGDRQLPIKAWLRAEWQRSGLPMYEANRACGVKNAATRKYLTACHLWYFPPAEALVAMADWCSRHGRSSARPYFSLDGEHPPSAKAWERMRAKWNHSHGVTNVWRNPPVHGSERVREGEFAVAHSNQKPLALMERQIQACTSKGDVVWEPFGGLCSASVAAIRLGRIARASEVNPQYFAIAVKRLRQVVEGEGRLRRVA